MGELQVSDMKRKCDEMEFIMGKLNVGNQAKDDTNVRQISFETNINTKVSDIVNELKGWGNRIGCVEGKQ